jgi:hypothetical protein
MPDPGLAERVFRQRYLSTSAAHASDSLLKNLLGVATLQREGKTSVLTSADIEQILESILSEWSSGRLRRAVEEPRAWRTLFDLEDYREALAAALGQVILPLLTPTSPNIGEVIEMISDLRELDFPVEATYPALARLRPDLLPELSDRLRQSLTSSQRKQAEAAMDAVWWWLQEGKKRLDLGEPPADLVREVAIAVSTRRPGCLKHALRLPSGSSATVRPARPTVSPGSLPKGSASCSRRPGTRPAWNHVSRSAWPPTRSEKFAPFASKLPWRSITPVSAICILCASG